MPTATASALARGDAEPVTPPGDPSALATRIGDGSVSRDRKASVTAPVAGVRVEEWRVELSAARVRR
jgi:hypothetical protein